MRPDLVGFELHRFAAQQISHAQVTDLGAQDFSCEHLTDRGENLAFCAGGLGVRDRVPDLTSSGRGNRQNDLFDFLPAALQLG